MPELPKWGQEVVFPTSPDLANILGDTDFDLPNLYFLDLFGSQISRLLDFWIPSCQLAWLAQGQGGDSGRHSGPQNSGGPRNEDILQGV